MAVSIPLLHRAYWIQSTKCATQYYHLNHSTSLRTLVNSSKQFLILFDQRKLEIVYFLVGAEWRSAASVYIYPGEVVLHTRASLVSRQFHLEAEVKNKSNDDPGSYPMYLRCHPFPAKWSKSGKLEFPLVACCACTHVCVCVCVCVCVFVVMCIGVGMWVCVGYWAELWEVLIAQTQHTITRQWISWSLSQRVPSEYLRLVCLLLNRGVV